MPQAISALFVVAWGLCSAVHPSPKHAIMHTCVTQCRSITQGENPDVHLRRRLETLNCQLSMLPVRDAALQVCEARFLVCYLHSRCCTHSDVKKERVGWSWGRCACVGGGLLVVVLVVVLWWQCWWWMNGWVGGGDVHVWERGSSRAPDNVCVRVRCPPMQGLRAAVLPPSPP
jgi:hypothetical protein